jgi:hypothetical protein
VNRYKAELNQEPNMINVKSLLAGIAAMVAALILYFGVLVVSVFREAPPGTVVGWDVPSFTRQPFFWLIPLLDFATAFYWEFRRASR